MDKLELQEHIYAFYRSLIGANEPKFINLVVDLWLVDARVSHKENEDLSITFLAEELDDVLKQKRQKRRPDMTAFQLPSSRVVGMCSE